MTQTRAPVYTALPPFALLYTSPAGMLEEIERAGRRVTVTTELLPQQFNHNGEHAHVVTVTPAMCGLPGGSFRRIDGHIRKKFGLRTVPRFIACNTARTLPHGPDDLDIVVAMDFVNGMDGKPYLFVISNRTVLKSRFEGPHFTPVYFDKPFDKDPDRDYIASDQMLLYLAPLPA